MQGKKRDFKVLVPVDELEIAPNLIRTAAALTREQTGKLIVLSILEVPEGQSLTEATSEAQRRRQRLQEMALTGQVEHVDIRTMVRVTHQVWQEIVDTVVQEECDLLLMSWKGFSSTPGRVFGTTIDTIMAHPPCDIAVISPLDLAHYDSILLPARGGPYARLAMDVATCLAETCKATITVMHVFNEDLPESERFVEERPYSEFMGHVQMRARVRKLLAVSSSVEDSILDEARHHHLVIMGASGHEISTKAPFGSIPQQVVQRAERPVIVVKTKEAIDADSLLKHRRIEAPASRGSFPSAELSSRVDKWFAENTFNHAEFADIGKLVSLKQSQGVTISLGLPALNEEETIGAIIGVIKQSLMEEYPLLDEMVLIDSRSTDRTVEIAREHGIPVFVHQDVLPGCRSFRGKGEALWKSLHVLRGDIIAWIDTDIKNICPQFVYGLVGPLLCEPHIKYVKGYYRRPIKLGNELFETGGGRVTELTVRPLFNLFYPELSGLIQPLAGEYAGRRDALEQVRFFTGYGVETGLLIDLLEQFGLDSIAQVNLEQRIHRNQSLAALSMMAFAIVQVVMERLERRSKINLLEEMNKSMKLIKFQTDHLSLDVRDIQDRERPPIVTVSEYRRRRHDLIASNPLDLPPEAVEAALSYLTTFESKEAPR